MNDVLILGDGAAGLAAAIILKQKGKTVTVAGKKSNVKRLRAGESLSSSALISLRELDLSNAFFLDNHPPCYGNSSSWGNNKLSYFDFIQSANGPGWYIDRSKFDAMLKAGAKASGVKFIAADRKATLSRNNDDTWYYTAGVKDDRPLHSRMVIDASGRHGWLGRHLGIDRWTEDKQIAIVALLTAEQHVKSSHSMVEAVKDGWWYLGEAGNNKTACIFFTDPALHKRTDLTSSDYFNFIREQTVFVKHRVPAGCYHLAAPLELTSAGSSHLAQFHGNGWLAAGDAACTMDPISSHGIAFALRSGIDAGKAANHALEGSLTACEAYNENLQAAVRIYKEQRAGVYRQEKRWTDTPFWQQRHLLATPEIR